MCGRPHLVYFRRLQDTMIVNTLRGGSSERQGRRKVAPLDRALFDAWLSGDGEALEAAWTQL